MTELIIFKRPNQALLKPGSVQGSPNNALGLNGNYVAQGQFQQNYKISLNQKEKESTGGMRVDLFEDISIPITYSINDIKDPGSRKTSWSKTIRIPGTKNNSRIFDHIYEIQSDSWTQIAGKSVWTSFNPNLKTEIVLLNDGVQVMKGNLQLRQATRDLGGNIEYEIALNGELTSLFSDIGDAKLNEFDFTEYDHEWNKESVVNSWSGLNLNTSGIQNTTFTLTLSGTVSNISKDPQTGRLAFTTTAAHGLNVGDWVRINLDVSTDDRLGSAAGEWQVQAKSSTTFIVNYFYPIALSPFGEVISGNHKVYKVVHTGTGFVYPMIQWGDEVDYNTWPVTSFAPSLYLKTVVDKIFESSDSTYQSNFFDSQDFKRLIFTQKFANYDIDAAELKSRKFWVGLTSSYKQSVSALKSEKFYWFQNANENVSATSSTLGSLFATKVPFKKESGSFNATASFYDNGSTASNVIGNWNESTYVWKVSDDGIYQLNANLLLSCQCKMNGFAGTTGSATQSMQPLAAGYRYWPGNKDLQQSSPWNAGGCGIRVVANFFMSRNGVTTNVAEIASDRFYFNLNSYWTSDNPNWSNFGTYQPENWKNFQFPVTSSNLYFSKDDLVWCELKYYVQARPNGEFLATTGHFSTVAFHEVYADPSGEVKKDIRGDWQIELLSNSYIFNEPLPRVVENSILPTKSFLPKEMTAKEFLIGLMKMFNLLIEPDRDVERKYHIEPLSDYYYDGSSLNHFVDWSNKVDTQNIEIYPMSELTAKNYIFKNKEETDKFNQKFKSERGRPYQYYKKEIENDFLKETVSIELPFGSSVMTNVPQGSDVVMPSIYTENNGEKQPVQNPLSRILFWGGMRPYTGQRGGSKIDLDNPQTSWKWGWELVSSQISATQAVSWTQSVYIQYPYAGTCDVPQDPQIDLNWYNLEEGDFVYWDFARWTNNNLYNTYWSDYITEISDPGSKSIICDLYLTPTDISNLDFRKIYVIDGNWLRLQTVYDFDANGNSLTRCQFLKLTRGTKFSKRSIIANSFGQVNTQFEVAGVLNPNPVPSGTQSTSNYIEYIPSSKKGLGGWNNKVISQDLSSNQTIQTNGQSNYVASTAKNVKINGNENVVGDKSQNIHISSGNGNQISGSQKNVTIIGTDGKLINESDVSYINGIRFKFGNPTSRSNVIDAGADTIQNKHSMNTTTNVFDAGEDIVIDFSTNGFENVIDSGSDAILPDLPEIGFSTITNPNPRTNLFGPYSIGSPTYSIIDAVRETTYYKS
jgi:hypothetical protein